MMGGMFTLVKVRDKVSGQEDPGWYDNPQGTMAWLASGEELARDGIVSAAEPAAPPAMDHGQHQH
jgi:manganese oxidase